MVPVRSLSSFITFQGSVSARYLLPRRAKSITKASASLKRNLSMEALILSGKAAKASNTS